MAHSLWFWSPIALSSFVYIGSSAFAAPSPVDESPLDSLIPRALRDRIDARKSRHSALAVDPLGSFQGSRSADLRHRDTEVKQQFKARKCAGLHTMVGTCSTFGLTAAIENALGGTVNLSERQLWSQYCIPSSSAAMESVTQGKGMVDESFWAQDSLRPQWDYADAARYKVTAAHDLEDSVPAMLAALDAGHPLYFAINTPSEMYARLPVVSAGSGNTGGGHAVAIVGYRLDDSVEGGGYFLVKNSWGPSNGENGYQWLSIGYCARPGNYCAAWSIEQISKY
jgi:hypothetical protein